MKEDMKRCDCGCACCGEGGMSWHHHGGGGKHWLFTIGILALVYGIVSWAMIAYSLPMYMGWIIGGVLLILVAWLKKWKYMMMTK